ncbi:hypothetical protein [Nocardia australiensis]|uniref:hypothetical protein n=1 Tax=Nocardia australiensis TaxID=2887191 RepID=UPI001D13FEA6|nr:hypothetical protein [Nocardia australiensis]
MTDPADTIVTAEPAPEPVAEPTARGAEDYEAEIAKLRKEAAGWRTKLREVEPLAQKYAEAEEAQKSEIQRATERATQAEAAAAEREAELTRVRTAIRHGIPEEDMDLLGSGTPEELDARGARIAALRQASVKETTPPPTDRPVESLRPGASPTPPPAVDNSYPAAWLPRERT